MYRITRKILSERIFLELSISLWNMLNRTENVACDIRTNSELCDQKPYVAVHRNVLPAWERHKEIHLVSHRTMKKWIFRVDNSIFQVSFGIEIFCISGIILGNTEKYSKDAELPCILFRLRTLMQIHMFMNIYNKRN